MERLDSHIAATLGKIQKAQKEVKCRKSLEGRVQAALKLALLKGFRESLIRRRHGWGEGDREVL